jgi:hypothetical protein
MMNNFLQPVFCPNPIFIIGAPRSGTTVLAKALAHHSHFWTSDETFFMCELFGDGRVDMVFERWSDRPSSSWLRTEKVDRDEFLSFLGLGLNALFTSRSKGKRWIDHTPHHALMAEVLGKMFPGALFLHILRDGRQVVNSMINIARTVTTKEFAKMQEGNFLPPWARDFREACRTWRRQTQAALDFCNEFPDRSLTISHQQLESEPPAAFGRIFSFLEVPDEDGPEVFIKSNRINSSFRNSASNQASPPTRPKPWEIWTEEQKSIFKAEAGEAFIHLGLGSAEELAL